MKNILSINPDIFTYWGRDILTAATLLVLSRSDWMLANLFFNNHTVLDISLAILILFTSVTCILFFLAIQLPIYITKFTLRIFIISYFIYIIYLQIRGVFPTLLQREYLITILIGTLLISYLAAKFVPIIHWKRLCTSFLVFGIILFATPFIAVQIIAKNVTIYAPINAPGHASTAVLILDELDANALPEITQALQTVGAAPKTKIIKAVANNTLNVIPEMLGGQKLPHAKICTPTAVCSDYSAVEYAKLHFDPQSKFHIIGFYGPYCSATGYASCRQLSTKEVGIIHDLAASFICPAINLLSPHHNISFCNAVEITSPYWIKLKEISQEAVGLSPFWDEGGVLLAHMPFPHPPGRLPVASLQDDYTDSVLQAASFAANIWNQGKQRFGSSFRLIITSDHPLRYEKIWCNYKKYKEPNCLNLSLHTVKDMVPYITVGLNFDESSSPTSNGEILNLSLSHSK